jgi:parallel beta-helix repeat protein
MNKVKRANFKISIMFILLFLITYGTTLNSGFNNTSATKSSTQIPGLPSLDDLVFVPPIVIDYDSDFEAYGFPGDGSPSDPYRIENYNITTTSDSCISFGGFTTKHFIIQNCYLKTDTNYTIVLGKHTNLHVGSFRIEGNDIESSSGGGLRIKGSLDGGAYYNNIVSFDAGIVIEDSNFTYVKGNTVYASTAVKLTNSHLASIIQNDFDKNAEIGIELDFSNDATITGNNFSYLVLRGSINGKIVDNYVVDVDGGIDIRDSDFTYVKGNIVQANTGIRINNSNYVELIYNTCNNNAEVGIKVTNSGDAVITGNNCTNNGDSGIRAEMSNDLAISHNYLIDNYFGMRIISSSESLITNNHFETNTGYGLSMQSSTGLNKIYHNVFLDNNLLGSTIQAFDDTGDQWYNEVLLEGNYWDDFTGTTSSSYTIEGAAGSEDLYPLDYIPDVPELSVNYLVFLVFTISFAIPVILLKRRRN